VAIIDGDTIDVSIGEQVFAVRYIGINTPERGQVCGSDASGANAALVSRQTVTLVKDVSETDRYGRLLRYVYVGSTFVNAVLVQNGWAEAVAYPPDTTYATYLDGLEAQARAANIGCWPAGAFGGALPTATSQPQPTQPPSQPTQPPSQPTQPPSAPCDCYGPDLDCGDFSTHNQAQACFDHCRALGLGDVFRLDGNGDGSACESLP
jgi:micrococcal nuclease